VKETGVAGRAWVEGFLRLNPIIASFKAQNLNHGTDQKLNRFIVNDYFEKLKITMEEIGIMNKPECIYNVDGKRMRIVRSQTAPCTDTKRMRIVGSQTATCTDTKIMRIWRSRLTSY
jgi:hypothetical protein